MKKILITGGILVLLANLGFTQTIPRVEKSNAEWKTILSSDEYNIIREKGTERAFTGELLKESRKGVYTCKACSNPLFLSSAKFKSGTGWPSFYEALPGHVSEEIDDKFGIIRTEILCASCDGHLGHVFNDGPKPTNLRYCVNSLSLSFSLEQ